MKHLDYCPCQAILVRHSRLNKVIHNEWNTYWGASAYRGLNGANRCTIATSLVHSKIDYRNSLLLNLPATQTNRLQLVLNSAARAVTKTSKFHHITPILKTLHWLKINERIQYKVLSLTYKSLQTGHPCCLRSLSPNRSTRSSSLITLNRPANTSRLKISNRSFSHSAPVLWNNLPPDLR
jgi:hypothetical protein